jgi:hypothetical protein
MARSPCPSRIRHLIAVCWPFVVLEALQLAQFKVDTLMVFWLLSSEAAAQYETAYRLLEVSRLTVRPLAVITFPICAALNAQQKWAAARDYGARTTLAAAAIGCGTLLVGQVNPEWIVVTVWGPAYPLGEQLFPAVPVLRHGGIGVVLAEAADLWLGLLVRRINAGRRGKEILLGALLVRRHEQMRVDQRRQHACRLVRLDETHPAHVGGEIEDPRGTARGALARRPITKIELKILHVAECLKPFPDRLDVHGPDGPDTALSESAHQMTTDEPSRSRHKDRTHSSHRVPTACHLVLRRCETSDL